MVALLLIFFSLSTFAESKKLKQIGRYTLVRIKGEIPTQEVMKIVLDKYLGDIKYGFEMANSGDLYLPFIDQLKQASFVEKEIAIGDKFLWMLFRSKGRVKVAQDLEWAGKKPLPVFSFIVKRDYKNYEFIMPKPCGNISLIKVWETIPEAICDIKVSPAKANMNEPISVDIGGSQHAKSIMIEVFNPKGAKIATQTLTPDSSKWQTKFSEPGEYVFKAQAINMEDKASTNPCEAKAYINFPPVCKLWSSCLPCEKYVGRPITFDASQSTDPDGEVVRANFEIRDDTGNVIDTYTASDKPFIWMKTLEKAGMYTITTIVTDDFGAVSQPCSLDVEVTRKRLFFLVEGSLLFARGSHGSFGALRLGFLYELIPDRLDFTLSGGGALTLKDEPWKSFFLTNALLNIHAGNAFFGAGLGYASKVKEGRDSDFVLIGNLGYNLFSNWSSKGAIFFEGHAPVGEGRSFSKHHKLLLGFRYLF